MTQLETFIRLGWKVLEHKCRYYLLLDQSISDYEYDQIERQYDQLAEVLNLPKSASDMVDFDLNRPSCRRVYAKLSAPPPKVRRPSRSKVS